MGRGNNFSSEYELGKEESRLNVRGFKAVYERALEIATTYGKNLEDREKGYVAGVADKLMNYKGRAIDAAKLYSKIGLVKHKEIKEAVINGLVRDVAKTQNVNYMDRVRSFMKENNMREISKGINLEHAVMSVGRKMSLTLPLALVVSGALISSFRLTGNVIGNSAPVYLFGTGLFTVGLVWMFTQVKLRNN